MGFIMQQGRYAIIRVFRSTLRQTSPVCPRTPQENTSSCCRVDEKVWLETSAGSLVLSPFLPSRYECSIPEVSSTVNTVGIIAEEFSCWMRKIGLDECSSRVVDDRGR